MAALSPAQIIATRIALKAHGNIKGAARALGIAERTMRDRVAALDDPENPPISEVSATAPKSELEMLREQVYELSARLKAHQSNTVDADYVKSKIIGITADTTQLVVPPWTVNPVRGKALPGVPEMIWSDWHWGETVFADQVNGVNEFDLDIAKRRTRKLVERTIRLLRNHVVNPDYPGVVINLGGDMLSGDIHEELTNTNETPMMPALLDVYGELIGAIGCMANEFGNVLLNCVTGNHSRTTRKPVAKNRNYTNFDWLLYQLLSKHFEGDQRVAFYIPEGTDALYSVYGHKRLLTHGDQFRGGDGIIGAIGPITRGNARKLARNSAINREYDMMLLGHWHQYMPLHRTLVNGSLKGYDEYASANNFGYEPPIQAMWLTHPEHGVIMHLPVYLEAHAGRVEGAPWVQWKK